MVREYCAHTTLFEPLFVDMLTLDCRYSLAGETLLRCTYQSDKGWSAEPLDGVRKNLGKAALNWWRWDLDKALDSEAEFRQTEAGKDIPHERDLPALLALHFIKALKVVARKSTYPGDNPEPPPPTT